MKTITPSGIKELIHTKVNAIVYCDFPYEKQLIKNICYNLIPLEKNGLHYHIDINKCTAFRFGTEVIMANLVGASISPHPYLELTDYPRYQFVSTSPIIKEL